MITFYSLDGFKLYVCEIKLSEKTLKIHEQIQNTLTVLQVSVS